MLAISDYMYWVPKTSLKINFQLEIMCNISSNFKCQLSFKSLLRLIIFEQPSPCLMFLWDCCLVCVCLLVIAILYSTGIVLSIIKYNVGLYSLILKVWSWSYGRWIYNHLCNQCLSLLTLWVRIPLGRGVLDTPLCDKVCQWLTAGW